VDIRQHRTMHDLIYAAMEALYRKDAEAMRQHLEDAHAESICVCDSERKRHANHKGN